MRKAIVVAMVGIVGCAEGREPPAPTAMVNITSGLEFDFGPEGMCRNGSAAVDAVTQTCASPPPLDVMYPKVRVNLSPFALDVHEVTNLQYQYCVAKGVCTPPQFGNAPDPATQNDYYDNARFEDYPVVNVTWNQANEYCQFVGKRLPSEFEWERVAKGEDGQRQFPTTEGITKVSECIGVFNSTGCGGDLKMEEVATAAKDFVEEGGTRVYHLGGNAAEWTATNWSQSVTCQEDAPCPTKNECASIADVAARVACETAATIDPSQAGGCTACTTLSEGECYFMCAASNTSRSLVCTAYTEVMAADDIVPTTAEVAIRGGSVVTNKGSICLHHSWNRSQRLEKTKIGNYLGFRCAADLLQASLSGPR
jgi:formylglycine-generating enzyme required for sulfatase activity